MAVAKMSAAGFKLPSYTQGVMFITLAFFVLFTYFGSLGYALTATFGGFLLLGYWRHAKVFGWAGLAMVVLLVWLVGRSTLLYDMQSGADFGQYQTWEDQAWLKMILQPISYGALILGAMKMKDEDAFKLTGGLFYAFIGLCVLIIVDALSGAAIYQAISATIYKPIRPDLAMVKLSIATYAFVLLYWPIMLVGEFKSRGVQVVALGACVLTPIITGANAPVLAMVVSYIVFLIARYFPYIGKISIYYWAAFVVAFKILYFPVIMHLIKVMKWDDNVHQFLPPSWDARVDIWMFTAEKIMMKPFLGWGFDASRHFGKAIPLHPHNMSMQVGLELGYVGLFILAAFWVLLILRVGQGGPAQGNDPRALRDISDRDGIDTRPYVLASVAAFFTLAQLSFGIWQEWWLALAAIVAAVLVMTKKALSFVGK
ncbi:O-antigen ligase [Asticcacaulis sp. YBE204]|uniref:O-antigen ligase family protein n=1 Tax=Asticcacaulis sp. YBE204 TaxID=1282363 RepID=UPI0003C3B439|nr:O-antigen ligase family protein [Asticcacaulis sp. YBE204]ESQ78281.1 hypothetical protein AEYBE204_14010 [Asticcacaulis sp. YBE204]